MTDTRNDYLPVRGEQVDQTAEQRETGVRVIPTVRHEPIRQRATNKAQDVRNEILRNAHKNFTIAQEHLMEGIEWLEITGLIDLKMKERHSSLKRLISDVLESVEGLRKAYVHSSTL